MKAISRALMDFNRLITWTLFPLLILGVGKIYSCNHGLIFQTDHLMIHGRVLAGQVNKHSEHLHPVAGAEVLLTRFRIDGTLEVISENPASTDKNGYFTLVTAHHRVGDFMLVATNGVQEWRGMIRRESTNQDVILAEPISYETTIATHLYLSALRAGRTEMANYADILENIRAELTVMGYVSGPAFAREILELEHLTPDSFGKESRTP